MITVWGEGRGIRVVWLLEEMGLPYKLRPVNLLQDLSEDPGFLAINPSGHIPALQDDDMVMVESVAIMEYLLGRYGPSPLAPAPQDPAYGPYLQFMHLGEAGLTMPLYMAFVERLIAPEGVSVETGTRLGQEIFESRLGHVTRRLEKSPYMAGDNFTAADISITYALDFARRNVGLTLGAPEMAYLARTKGRDGYKRALDTCKDTKAWHERVGIL